MMKTILELLKKANNTYVKTVSVIFAVMWFLVEVLPYFGYDKPFEDIKNFVIFILILLLVNTLACILIYFHKRDKNNIDITIKKVRKMLNEKRHDDILILRKKDNWSRSLWVEGKPNERLQLGKLAKNAAMNSKNNQNLAEIYIDDLGWTSVSIQHYEDAKTYLDEGLKCLNTIQDSDDKYYWAAKAKRHLAGIEIDKQSYTMADNLMREATESANKIGNEHKKNEMLAGIYLGQSIRFLKSSSNNKQDIQTALDYAQKSENLRQSGEKTRFVKIYSLKGNIYEAQNNRLSAEQSYTSGLQEAEKIGRTDEIVKNCLGLARVSDNEKDKKRYLKRANKLLNKLPAPFPYIIDEHEMKLIKI